jgi:AraC family transcriptional regulator, transcriptional activator of the genes for pyochelin and ferripyochelin receptors
MAYHITAANVFELDDFLLMGQKPAQPTLEVSKHLDGIGQFQTSVMMLPYILILDFNWQTQEDIVLENDAMSNTININFHLQGSMFSSFPHIGPLNMNTCRHNLLFSPDVSKHQIARHQNIRMFHLSLSQDFFGQIIGCDNAWSEKALIKLEGHEPFKAIEGLPAVTPVMQQLICSIQNNTWQGSIRSLQLQSKVYELLALQLEQFKTLEAGTNGMSADDVEKLHFIKLYLQHHFLEELSLTGLCRVAMLNEFKLKKGFKQLFGTTVFAYVKTLQMDYASRLLKEERKTVEEVAYLLGYEHAQHFSTSFKKYFGNSPSQWGR